MTQFYDINTSRTTIFGWLKKYIQLINDHLNESKSELSKIWHTDEMEASVVGGGFGSGASWIEILDSY